MKFSIVVACYQSAEYVPECVASIKAQRGDWECFFRTEYSPDGSGEVARREIGDDPRFTVLEGEPSGGPGMARNIGLEKATGDYVVFLDGDDALAPDALARLEPFLKDRPDVATIAIDSGEAVVDPWDMVDGAVTGPEATVLQTKRPGFPLAMTQQFVVRTAYMREHGLRYITGYHHEDEEIHPRLVYLAEKLVATHQPVYLYRVREGSMMTLTKARKVLAIAKVMKSHFAFLRSVSPSEAVVRAWARMWLTKFFYGFFHPVYTRATPDGQVREALKLLFADGAAEWNRLAAAASVPRRVGARFVRFSAATGVLWPTRLYFRLYYRLCK